MNHRISNFIRPTSSSIFFFCPLSLSFFHSDSISLSRLLFIYFSYSLLHWSLLWVSFSSFLFRVEWQFLPNSFFHHHHHHHHHSCMHLFVFFLCSFCFWIHLCVRVCANKSLYWCTNLYRKTSNTQLGETKDKQRYKKGKKRTTEIVVYTRTILYVRNPTGGIWSGSNWF